MEERAPRGGMHEADQVAPGVAVLDRRDGALAVEAPDLVQDRFQPNAMLVGRPELDLGVRKGRGDGLGERADLFLKDTCCAGSAKTCRGRGLRRLPSRRTR